MRRDWRRHSLHDVIDVVEAGLDDRAAQGFEPRDINRDVVVDEEDDARAPVPRIADVVDHPGNREAVKIAAPHLDDRAEAAVEGAAPRCFDDVDVSAEHRVPERTRAARFGGLIVPSSMAVTGRGGVHWNVVPIRYQSPATADSGISPSSARTRSRNVRSASPLTMKSTPMSGCIQASGARLGS